MGSKMTVGTQTKNEPAGRMLLKMMKLWNDTLNTVIAKRLENAVEFGKKAKVPLDKIPLLLSIK